jgi:hypothetical protein
MISPILKTGLTVMSNMVGSVTLVIPGLFREQGLLSCLIVIVRIYRYRPLWGPSTAKLVNSGRSINVKTRMTSLKLSEELSVIGGILFLVLAQDYS